MRGWIRRLLRLPIFYKVLIGNSLIVLFGAVVGTWVTAGYARAYPDSSPESIMPLFAVIGLVLSLAVNFVVLKLALSPLAALEEAVSRVRNGDFRARVVPVPLSDPQVDQLRDTLNAMLDAVDRYRVELQLLSHQAISAQEEERKRVARELHDETAQALTSLLVRLRMVERATSLGEAREQIAELRELTAYTLDEVRNMALELRPSALDDLGLLAALEWYVRQWAQRFYIPVEFAADRLDGRLPPDAEVVFYRVVQEALTNVAKHANATNVRVRLSQRGGLLVAEVADDGHGFDQAEMLKSRERGLGLFGMQERLALIGGTLHIDSRPGHGTRIVATAALDARSPTPRPTSLVRQDALEPREDTQNVPVLGGVEAEGEPLAAPRLAPRRVG